MSTIDARFIHSARVRTGETPTGTADAYGKRGSVPTYTLFACTFSRPKGGMRRLESGDLVETLPTLIYPANVSLEEGQVLEGLSPGYTRHFKILKITPVYTRVLDHWRADIEGARAP